MYEAELRRLEKCTEDLLRAYQQVREENRSLHAQLKVLTSERAHLIEKAELAHARVEAMLSRLKSMEHTS